MKNQTIREDFSRAQKGNQNETQFAFFSEKAGEMFGVYWADITDAQGKTKKIAFTAMLSKKLSSKYVWADKELVWSGKLSAVSNVRKYKGKYEYPSQDVLDKAANDVVAPKNKSRAKATSQLKQK